MKSTQNSSCGHAVKERIKAYASVFGAYTNLVYNDLDVFEKMHIYRVIRRKIRLWDRHIRHQTHHHNAPAGVETSRGTQFSAEVNAAAISSFPYLSTLMHSA